MSTAIANRDGEVILSAAEVELVKRTVAKDASDEELRLFLHDCRRQGVHPLDKLIHFTKRGGRYTPITSIDFMRMRAADSGELAGNDDPTFTFKDGETVLPISASVTVYRIVQGQRCPFTATARWTEYKPPSGQDMMWMKMPQLMLGKCAEALALRKAFPKQLHGVYERAEMEQAGKEDHKPTRDAQKGRAGAAPSTIGAVPRSDEPAREPIPTEAELVTESENLFPTPDALRDGYITRIKKFPDAKVAVIRHRLDLGDSGYDGLERMDVAALDMLAKHLEVKAK